MMVPQRVESAATMAPNCSLGWPSGFNAMSLGLDNRFSYCRTSDIAIDNLRTASGTVLPATNMPTQLDNSNPVPLFGKSWYLRGPV